MPNAGERYRLFVAVFPPREVVEELSRAARTIGAGLSGGAVRWTPTEQIHLTLNFIGAVEAERVPEFAAVLSGVVPRHARMSLEAIGTRCFPSPRRPRIVWAGMGGQIEQLGVLKMELDEGLKGLGYEPEERSFHPHLTLGRVNQLRGRDQAALATEMARFEQTQFGAWQAERVDLMRSVLMPSGARYSVLQSFIFA